MRVTKDIEKTIIETQTQDILCNKCGNSLKDHEDINYEGLIEVGFMGGYASKIGDLVEIKFSLCEDCLIELFKTFKIQPYKDEHSMDEFWA